MMTLIPIQDAIVTLIALAAGAILLRRVFGFAKNSSEPSCAHCTAHPAKPAAGAQAAKATVFPLTLVRADGAPRSSSNS